MKNIFKKFLILILLILVPVFAANLNIAKETEENYENTVELSEDYWYFIVYKIGEKEKTTFIKLSYEAESDEIFQRLLNKKLSRPGIMITVISYTLIEAYDI